MEEFKRIVESKMGGAIADKLGLDATANPAPVGFMLEQNALEKASLIFYYKNK